MISIVRRTFAMREYDIGDIEARQHCADAKLRRRFLPKALGRELFLIGRSSRPIHNVNTHNLFSLCSMGQDK